MTPESEAYRLAVAEIMKDVPRRAISVPSEHIEITDEVRRCFRMIKIGLPANELAAKRESLEGRIEETDRKCREISAQLKRGGGDFIRLNNLQKSRTEYKRKLQELDDSVSKRTYSFGDADVELRAILDLPQVIDACVLEPDLLAITVLATYEHKSVIYHLGTWDVYIGSVDDHLPGSSGSKTLFRTFRAVETRIDPSGTTTGFYNYEDRSFCFGVNQTVICKYLRQHNYLHAMQMIVQCMCWLSESKLAHLPAAFKVYKPTGE